jgi:hypothetical protein
VSIILISVEDPEPHSFRAAGAASFQCGRSHILLTAAGAVMKLNSGAKPDVQNRTIKKKQVLRSSIKNPGENVMRLWSRQNHIKILTRSRSREPCKHNAAAELLVQF